MEDMGSSKVIVDTLAQCGATPAIGLFLLASMFEWCPLFSIPLFALFTSVVIFISYMQDRYIAQNEPMRYEKYTSELNINANQVKLISDHELLVDRYATHNTSTSKLIAPGEIPAYLARTYEYCDSLVRGFGNTAKHVVYGLVFASKCTIVYLSSYVLQIALQGVLCVDGSIGYDGASYALSICTAAGLAALTIPKRFRYIFGIAGPVLSLSGLGLWIISNPSVGSDTAFFDSLSRYRDPLAICAIIIGTHTYSRGNTQSQGTTSPGYRFTWGTLAALLPKLIIGMLVAFNTDNSLNITGLLHPQSNPTACTVAARLLCGMGILSDMCIHSMDMRAMYSEKCHTIKMLICISGVAGANLIAYMMPCVTSDRSACWGALISSIVNVCAPAISISSLLLPAGVVLWHNKPLLKTIKGAVLAFLAIASILFAAFAMCRGAMVLPNGNNNRELLLIETTPQSTTTLPMITPPIEPANLHIHNLSGGSRPRADGKRRKAVRRDLSTNTSTQAVQEEDRIESKRYDSAFKQKEKESATSKAHWLPQYGILYDLLKIPAQNDHTISITGEPITKDPTNTMITPLPITNDMVEASSKTCLLPPHFELLQSCRILRHKLGEYMLFAQFNPTDVLEVSVTKGVTENNKLQRNYSQLVKPVKDGIRDFYLWALYGFRYNHDYKHIFCEHVVNGNKLTIRARLNQVESMELSIDTDSLVGIDNDYEGTHLRPVPILSVSKSPLALPPPSISDIEEPYCQKTPSIVFKSCFVTLHTQFQFSIAIFPRFNVSNSLTWRMGMKSEEWTHIDCERMLDEKLKDLLCPHLFTFEMANMLIEHIYAEKCNNKNPPTCIVRGNTPTEMFLDIRLRNYRFVIKITPPKTPEESPIIHTAHFLQDD